MFYFILFQKLGKQDPLTEVIDPDHGKTNGKRDGDFHQKIHQTAALFLGYSTIVSIHTYTSTMYIIYTYILYII